MANSLQTGFSPELWSARTQVLLKNNLVAGAIANTEERAQLTYGYRVHRPYHSEVYASDYTKGTNPSILDVSATDEYLSVDQAKIIPLYLDDIDKIQNKYQTMDLLSERSAYQLRDTIDKKVLAEVSNAGLSISAATTLNTANIVQTFSEAKAALFNNGVEENKPWYTVLDPDTVSIIEQYFSANGFKRQDETLDNGFGISSYLGDWLGLKCFKSQNVPSTVALSLATQPTANDTLTINGVVFKFVANGTAANAGEISLGANIAATQPIIVTAINGTGTPGASTYIELSSSDRAKLKRSNVVAAAFAANKMTVTAGGKMVLSKSLTDGTDNWGTQTMDIQVAQMGAIDLVIQSDVRAEFKRDPYKPGTQIQTWSLYGTKTFKEGAQRMYKLTKNV